MTASHHGSRDEIDDSVCFKFLYEEQPRWTLPKASRDTEKKVYISKKHPQDLLGRASPGPAGYEPKRQKELPKWGFGTAVARPHIGGPIHPGDSAPEPSTDLSTTESEKPRFDIKKKKSFMSAPRDAGVYQPDFDGFPAGLISPGPQGYEPTKKSQYSVRLSHSPNIDHIPSSYTLRPYYPPPASVSQTPPEVGPGLYKIPSGCGKQIAGAQPSKPQWAINKNERFPEKKITESGEMRDGTGEKKIQFNRTFNQGPSFSFGTSTRGHAQKVARCDTKLDKGPGAFMEKPWKSHPSIPTRKELLKFTQVPSG